MNLQLCCILSTGRYGIQWIIERVSFMLQKYILLEPETASVNSSDFQSKPFERIYDVVRRIPSGRVCTYGMVAALAGNSRWSRVVGYALHGNPSPETIPCYRVVNRFGELSQAFAFGGINRQRELLEAEGVQFTEDGRVDMLQFLWTGEEVE